MSQASQGIHIPSPAEYFGFEPGSEGMLADWPALVGYFKALGEASDRVVVEEIGTSTEGRPFLLCTVSSSGNIDDREELLAIQQRLGDPRGLSQEEGERLSERGRAVALISMGIHPSESGASQTAPRLAYEVATSESAEMQMIRENVILLIVPSVNPDGLDLVVDWHNKTKGSSAEGTWPPSISHKYAGGENNRDWFMLTQVENQIMVDQVFLRWHPQISFDHHQMEEDTYRYFIPPYIDPYNPNIDPQVQASVNQLGTDIVASMTEQGLTGIITSMHFESWSPSSSFHPYHGGVHLLSEAASVKLATSITVGADELKEFHGRDPKQRSAYHPMPWPGGEWRLMDILDYNMAANLALLENAARNRKRWVRNYWRIKERACRITSPSAYAFPADVTDSVTQAELLQVLQRGGVEVHRTLKPFVTDDRTYPSGTFLVRTDQPASAFIKTLLDVQSYPELRDYPGGPAKQPYDISTHHLPLMMGVECDRITQPVNDLEVELVEAVQPRAGRVTGDDSSLYALRCDTNASALAVNRLLKAGASVSRTEQAFRAQGEEFAPGTYIIEAPGDTLSNVASESHVEFVGLSVSPPDQRQPVSPSRLGVYRSWLTGFAACDEGWLRFVLDGYEFEYASVRNRDLTDPSLSSKFDTIILPHHLAGDLMYGQDPFAYAGATPQTRNHGLDDGSEDQVLGDYPAEYARGIGSKGMAGLRAFVEAGGTLITLDASSNAAIRYLYLPVKNVVEGLPKETFSNPGSLMSVVVNPAHRLGYGYNRSETVLFADSAAFSVCDNAKVIAHYPLRPEPSAGWMHGGELISNTGALVEVPVGKGRVILFGFRPQFRAQTRATYRFLFNAIYSSSPEQAN